MDKSAALYKYFGYSEFRSGQAELIDSILSGRDVLGIMPTGAGKSICYQLPALLAPGMILVISPLISLMKDQVSALIQSGVPAAYLNSTLNPAQQLKVLSRASENEYKILYVAPERLSSNDFLDFALRAQISMITIDEAHCVSQWGHDFRPSYLRISDFIQRLPKRPVLSAFTATATSRVRNDIINALQLKAPHILITGFDRKNLYFVVQKPSSKKAALFKLVNKYRNKSGIIYCSTRKSVEDVCGFLNQNGFNATRYHAGLSDSERHKNQDDFIYDRKTIMAATNAFGMGIDKSNVSFVIHYNMPKNLESYYQEAGRAGRDGEPAECTILYSSGDVRTNIFLIENSQETNEELSDAEREAIRNNDLELLRQMTFYCSTSDCLRSFILRYFGETSPAYCGNCGSCNTKFDTVDITIEAQKTVSCVIRIDRQNRSFGKTMIANILHGSKSAKISELGLDKLPTYGIMAELSIHRIICIIDALIDAGYLMTSGGDYPVVTPGPRANEVIKLRSQVKARLPEEAKPTNNTKSVKTAAGKTTFSADEELLAKLKQLRTKLAAEQDLPPYVVFSNASLSDMCVKLPCTEYEFQSVSGVGPAKTRQYAQPFIKLIREHMDSTGKT